MTEKAIKKQRTFVREVAGAYGELYKSLFDAPRVYPSGDVPFHASGPQHWVKSVIDPRTVTVTQNYHSHIDVYSPGGHGKRHAHMNSAVFYILDGEGYDIHDGERYDWKAGDVCIVEPNCTHQHFNASKTEPVRVLVMKAKPLFIFTNLLYQRAVIPEPKDPVPGFEDFDPTVFKF
jgi:mannose-6-phosphate isomerase-like protein (cupin superfamily)